MQLPIKRICTLDYSLEPSVNIEQILKSEFPFGYVLWGYLEHYFICCDIFIMKTRYGQQKRSSSY